MPTTPTEFDNRLAEMKAEAERLLADLEAEAPAVDGMTKSLLAGSDLDAKLADLKTVDFARNPLRIEKHG